MAIELFHIGEVLVAEILRRLQERGDLDKVRDVRSNQRISLLDDLRESGVELPARFLPDLASLTVRSDKKIYSCDGEQTVDVLCAGSNNRAIAFEAKLGETAMTKAAFKKRFCAPCGTSKPSDSRLSGSMVAVLERQGKILQGGDLVAKNDLQGNDGHEDGRPQEWAVVPRWWLVIRQRVWKSWDGDAPIQNGRVVLLEDLTHTYGSEELFNTLVTGLVGSNFAKRWKIFP